MNTTSLVCVSLVIRDCCTERLRERERKSEAKVGLRGNEKKTCRLFSARRRFFNCTFLAPNDLYLANRGANKEMHRFLGTTLNKYG